MASDKALMEANQHQELLDAGHDAELTRQAKSAMCFTGSILPTPGLSAVLKFLKFLKF